MYSVYFVNFGYAHAQTCATLDEAITLAKRCCFEASILRDGAIVATFSPISGVTRR